MNRSNVLIALAEKEVLYAVDAYEHIFYESESSFFLESKEKNIFVKIKEFFQKLIDNIMSALSNKKRQKIAYELEAISKDPKLKNKKIKLTDTSKLEKLDDETLQKLKNPKADTMKVMEQYRKRRKAILGSLGIVTVTAGALFSLYKVLHKKGTKEMEDTEKVTVQIVNQAIKYKNPKIVNKVIHIKNRTKTAKVKKVEKTSDSSINEIVAATMEIAKNKKNTILMKDKLTVSAYKGQIQYANGKYYENIRKTTIVRKDTKQTNELYNQYTHSSNKAERKKLRNRWAFATGENTDAYKNYVSRGSNSNSFRAIEYTNTNKREKYNRKREKQGLKPDADTKFTNYI